MFLHSFYCIKKIEPCHADSCSLFFGGEDKEKLAGVAAFDIENWIKDNNDIPPLYEHVSKRKREKYVLQNLLIFILIFNIKQKN